MTPPRPRSLHDGQWRPDRAYGEASSEERDSGAAARRWSLITALRGLFNRRSEQPPAEEARRQRMAVITPNEARQLVSLITPLCGPRAPQIAGQLLVTFGSLPAVLRARRPALAKHLGDEPAILDMLLAVRPLIREVLRTEMLDAPVLPDSKAALDYLHLTLAHEPNESAWMLYLDVKNRILAEEPLAHGSVTKADIFPREIMRRALDLGATGLIIAHNHPSGDPEPSRSDLRTTRAIVDAARLFDIQLHDHIIIARSGSISLRGAGYL